MADTGLFTKFCCQGMFDGEPRGVDEWYYLKPLRKRNKVCGLIVGVHPLAHEIVCELFASSVPGVASVAGSLGVEVISPKNSDYWGFGEIFKTVKTTDAFVEYQVNISEASDLVSCGLDMLLTLLTFHMEASTGVRSRQLAIIDGIGTGSGMSAKGIGAYISPIWRNWLIINDNRHHHTVSRAMMEIFNRTCSKYPAELHEFRIWTDKDRFVITVPGNCACFGVDGMQRSTSERVDMVYHVSPHNMDNLHQQFSILTGFAQIWELVRESHRAELNLDTLGN